MIEEKPLRTGSSFGRQGDSEPAAEVAANCPWFERFIGFIIGCGAALCIALTYGGPLLDPSQQRDEMSQPTADWIALRKAKLDEEQQRADIRYRDAETRSTDASIRRDNAAAKESALQSKAFQRELDAFDRSHR